MDKIKKIEKNTNRLELINEVLDFLIDQKKKNYSADLIIWHLKDWLKEKIKLVK